MSHGIPYGWKFTPSPEMVTKRELFAAMAMQGRAAVPGTPDATHDARIAVAYADALLVELEKAK